MKRIVALAFWALWARESLTVGHHRIIFGMEEKGGPWGSRKRTNQSELDGEDVGLGLAIGDQLVSEPPVRKQRSEERRVGKEGRSRWSPYHSKKKRAATAGMVRPPSSADVRHPPPPPSADP